MAKMAKNRHFFTIIGRFEGAKNFDKKKHKIVFVKIHGIKEPRKKVSGLKKIRLIFGGKIGQLVPKLAPKWPKWPKIAIFSL